MKIKLIIVFIFCFIFCGCYNYNELNTLAIATGMSIDYKDEEYIVSVLIANSKQAQVSSKEGESQSIVYEGSGKTISQALKKIDITSPKTIYLGHLSFIVVSEELSKHGLQDSLDYLLRSPESIKRFYLIVSKDKEAKSILQIVSPLESFPSQSISTAISFSKESEAVTSTLPYSTFIEKLVQRGVEPVLPSMELIGDVEEGKSEESLQKTTPATYLQLSNLIIFKKDKMVSRTTSEESNGINLINNVAKELLVEVPCKNGVAEVNISNIHVDKKVYLKPRPTVKIKVDGRARLQEITCDIDLNDINVIKNIENEAEEKVENLINKAVDISKEYETDIFGFGNLFYKFYPSFFKTYEKKWNEDKFKTLKIKKDIKIKLESKGSIQKTIKEK